MAAAQALSDTYIRTRSDDGRGLTPVDLRSLHSALMENVLHGYDVLPSAVHLTASTLAMLAPEVAFRAMNLYVMPLGMVREMGHDVPRLGSLDFLTDNEFKTQMALDYSHAEVVRTGAAFSHATKAKVPELHLCVMNPPFVRSVGGNLLFGSLPDERGKLQKELKARVKKIGASATAGLGSVFVALADRWLAKGGRLAFVLPAALVSGEAWAATRKLIAERYHLETVIASHDAERPNFSENTDLSEVLFIARKLADKEQSGPTTYINLWRNPRSIHEALDLANRITHTPSAVGVEGVGFTTIRSPSGKLGEIVTTPAPTGEDNWTGALFAQTELLRACWTLRAGNLRVPGSEKSTPIKVCRLDALGGLGYDRRDIHDAFEVSTDDISTYPAFWGHEADKVVCVAQKPNAHLIARTKPAKGRKEKHPGPVWSKAGNILLVERLRSNTHKILAVGFGKPVLGNTWWAFKSAGLSRKQEKALLLWLNSSLSMLLFFGCRVITQGAWMQMKKPGWLSMPVLDVRALTDAQQQCLSEAYDKLAPQSLDALAKLDKDAVRGAIDEALASVLGLPDLAHFRELLAREPGLNAKDINPRLKQAELFEEPEEDDEDDAA